MIWEDTGRQIAARSKAYSNTDSRKIVVFVMGDKSSGMMHYSKENRQ